MTDKRREKRYKREHRARTNLAGAALETGPEVRLIYRPKDQAEVKRRMDRAQNLVGTPFITLPNITDRNAALFRTKQGTPVSIADAEMVFNDSLLMDAVSDWGSDGPLYRDTLENDEQREMYDTVHKAFKDANVEIPQKLQRPSGPVEKA
jgi:hypothetical protein